MTRDKNIFMQLNDDQNLKFWLAASLSRLNDFYVKLIFENYHDIKPLWYENLNKLAKIDGIKPEFLQKVSLARRSFKLARIENYLEQINSSDIQILSFENSNYPERLKQISDPPAVLYIKGEIPKNNNFFAIVGTRKASVWGEEITFKFSYELSQNGLTIVSGMALGIDTAAHWGALKEGKKTVGVLGCGVNFCYPPQNKKLRGEIIKNGCLMSEFPPNTKPQTLFFPRRNRIITGLSLGTLVVEAALKSGALISARLAAEQGRDVFAVPGSISSQQTKGTHHLIKQGAKLVENIDDILEELNLPRLKTRKKNRIFNGISNEEKIILNSLEKGPIQIDKISQESSFSMVKLLPILTQMEIKGLIKQYPGKMFSQNLET